MRVKGLMKGKSGPRLGRVLHLGFSSRVGAIIVTLVRGVNVVSEQSGMPNKHRHIREGVGKSLYTFLRIVKPTVERGAEVHRLPVD